MATGTGAGLREDINLPFEQPFELYHNAFSLCSMKVRLCLAELDITYRSHHIDLIETGCYENIRRAFKRVNPGGTVPVLVHNGHPVFESHEQIRYAASTAPIEGRSLLPGDPETRAAMERWVDLSSLTDDPLQNTKVSAGNAVPGQTLPLFTTMIEKIPYRRIAEGFLFHFDKRRPLMFSVMKRSGLRIFDKSGPLRAALQSSAQDMHKHIGELENQCRQAQGPWIVGDQFTLADVSWMVIFERLHQADCLDVFVTSDKHPACRAWWNACTSRASYTEAIVSHEHTIVRHGSEQLRKYKAANPSINTLLVKQPG